MLRRCRHDMVMVRDAHGCVMLPPYVVAPLRSKIQRARTVAREAALRRGATRQKQQQRMGGYQRETSAGAQRVRQYGEYAV